jgi:hypothetical protein
MLKKFNTYTIDTTIYYILHGEFEYTKGVTRIRKWKKDRQHNDQR